MLVVEPPCHVASLSGHREVQCRDFNPSGYGRSPHCYKSTDFAQRRITPRQTGPSQNASSIQDDGESCSLTSSLRPSKISALRSEESLRTNAHSQKVYETADTQSSHYNPSQSGHWTFIRKNNPSSGNDIWRSGKVLSTAAAVSAAFENEIYRGPTRSDEFRLIEGRCNAEDSDLLCRAPSALNNVSAQSSETTSRLAAASPVLHAAIMHMKSAKDNISLDMKADFDATLISPGRGRCVGVAGSSCADADLLMWDALQRLSHVGGTQQQQHIEGMLLRTTLKGRDSKLSGPPGFEIQLNEAPETCWPQGAAARVAPQGVGTAKTVLSDSSDSCAKQVSGKSFTGDANSTPGYCLGPVDTREMREGNIGVEDRATGHCQPLNDQQVSGACNKLSEATQVMQPTPMLPPTTPKRDGPALTLHNVMNCSIVNKSNSTPSLTPMEMCGSRSSVLKKGFSMSSTPTSLTFPAASLERIGSHNIHKKCHAANSNSRSPLNWEVSNIKNSICGISPNARSINSQHWESPQLPSARLSLPPPPPPRPELSAAWISSVRPNKAGKKVLVRPTIEESTGECDTLQQQQLTSAAPVFDGSRCLINPYTYDVDASSSFTYSQVPENNSNAQRRTNAKDDLFLIPTAQSTPPARPHPSPASFSKAIVPSLISPTLSTLTPCEATQRFEQRLYLDLAGALLDVQHADEQVGEQEEDDAVSAADGNDFSQKKKRTRRGRRGGRNRRRKLIQDSPEDPKGVLVNAASTGLIDQKELLTTDKEALSQIPQSSFEKLPNMNRALKRSSAAKGPISMPAALIGVALGNKDRIVSAVEETLQSAKAALEPACVDAQSVHSDPIFSFLDRLLTAEKKATVRSLFSDDNAVAYSRDEEDARETLIRTPKKLNRPATLCPKIRLQALSAFPALAATSTSAAATAAMVTFFDTTLSSPVTPPDASTSSSVYASPRSGKTPSDSESLASLDTSASTSRSGLSDSSEKVGAPSPQPGVVHTLDGKRSPWGSFAKSGSLALHFPNPEAFCQAPSHTFDPTELTVQPYESPSLWLYGSGDDSVTPAAMCTDSLPLQESDEVTEWSRLTNAMAVGDSLFDSIDENGRGIRRTGDHTASHYESALSAGSSVHQATWELSLGNCLLELSNSGSSEFSYSSGGSSMSGGSEEFTLTERSDDRRAKVLTPRDGEGVGFDESNDDRSVTALMDPENDDSALLSLLRELVGSMECRPSKYENSLSEMISSLLTIIETGQLQDLTENYLERNLETIPTGLRNADSKAAGLSAEGEAGALPKMTEGNTAAENFEFFRSVLESCLTMESFQSVVDAAAAATLSPSGSSQQLNVGRDYIINEAAVVLARLCSFTATPNDRETEVRRNSEQNYKQRPDEPLRNDLELLNGSIANESCNLPRSHRHCGPCDRSGNHDKSQRSASPLESTVSLVLDLRGCCQCDQVEHDGGFWCRKKLGDSKPRRNGEHRNDASSEFPAAAQLRSKGERQSTKGSCLKTRCRDPSLKQALSLAKSASLLSSGSCKRNSSNSRCADITKEGQYDLKVQQAQFVHGPHSSANILSRNRYNAHVAEISARAYLGRTNKVQQVIKEASLPISLGEHHPQLSSSSSNFPNACLHTPQSRYSLQAVESGGDCVTMRELSASRNANFSASPNTAAFSRGPSNLDEVLQISERASSLEPKWERQTEAPKWERQNERHCEAPLLSQDNPEALQEGVKSREPRHAKPQHRKCIVPGVPTTASNGSCHNKGQVRSECCSSSSSSSSGTYIRTSSKGFSTTTSTSALENKLCKKKTGSSRPEKVIVDSNKTEDFDVVIVDCVETLVDILDKGPRRVDRLRRAAKRDPLVSVSTSGSATSSVVCDDLLV